MRWPAWWKSSWLPAYRQGRVATLQRWFGWLDDQGGHRGTPDGRRAGRALLPRRRGGRPRPSGGPTWSIAGSTGTRPGPMILPPRRGPPCSGPSVPARGRADARRRRRGRAEVRGGGHRGAGGRALPGNRAVLSGDLDGADASFEEAISGGEEVGAPDDPRGRAVRTVAGGDGARRLEPGRGLRRPGARRLRRAGIEENALVCAVQARVACTGEISRRRGASSSAPSGCGPC